jgi:iron complex transport system permease protein
MALALGILLIAILPVLLSVVTPPAIPLSSLWSNSLDNNHYIFFNLRLPKHLLAFVVGAALSLSGTSFQSLLKNPLADPYILGVSGGAALGYVLAVVFGLPTVLMPIAGFAAALASLFLIYSLARTRGTLQTVNLLLTGIIFNSFSFAIILMVNAIASFGQSQQILYLLLGSVEPIGWGQLLSVTSFIFVALTVLFWRARELDLMALGDEEAFHLGVDVVREKKIIFITTSALVGASVSICGLIGFVGLFVPHLMRLFFGAAHKRLLPASAIFGGIFLMLSDFLASRLFAWDDFQTRLPVGVITALIGAPAFIFLLKRQANRSAS